MEKFEDYVKSFPLIMESFDLNTTYKLSNKVAPSQFYNYMTDLVDNPDWSEEDYNNHREVIKNGLNYIRGYTFEGSGEKFLIFFVMNIKSEVEVHFTNLTKNKFNVRTKSHGKTSTVVFATVIKTTIDFIKNSGYGDIRIKTDKDRGKLYKKLLDVTLGKYLPKWKFVKTDVHGDEVDFILKKNNMIDEIIMEK